MTTGAGKRYAADLVVLGVGVEPALGFEHDLTLAEKGGVAVDAWLKAAEGVWAAGDIASVDGLRIEHWRVAQQHAMATAKGMLGSAAEFRSVPFFWTTHYDKRLGYMGHAEEWDEVVYDGDVAGLKFLAFYVKAGKVAAVLSCGRDHETAVLAEPMRAPRTVEELQALVAAG